MNWDSFWAFVGGVWNYITDGIAQGKDFIVSLWGLISKLIGLFPAELSAVTFTSLSLLLVIVIYKLIRKG